MATTRARALHEDWLPSPDDDICEQCDEPRDDCDCGERDEEEDAP